MKTFGKICFAILLIGIGVLGTLAYHNWDTVKGWFNTDTETSEIVEEDSTTNSNVEIIIGG